MERLQELVQYLETKFMTRMDDLSLATIAKVGVVLVVVLPYPVYLAWRRYRNYRLYVKVRRDFAIYTAMDDLSVLGTLEPKTKLEGTAVIAGGSITGLIAARVCADYFQHVVIIEPDEGANTEFPATESRKDAHGNTSYVSKRSRVMQSFSLHLYQPFALLALRRLFPSFDEKFKRAGGRIKPWLYNGVWSGITLGYPRSTYLFGNGLPKHPNLPFADSTANIPNKYSASDSMHAPTSEDGYPDSIWMTRANLERFLRGEVVSTCSNVEVIIGSVADIVMDDKKKDQIRGVTYHTKGAKGTSTLDAALLVDCTGHSKKGAHWLEERGYGKVPEVTYDPLLRYTSVWFDLTDDQMLKLPIPAHLSHLEFYIFAFEAPEHGNRLLWASRGEGNTIALSFGGFGIESEAMPHTPEELKDFYRDMGTFSGRPMDGWYCNLVDYLSGKDGSGWRKAHYQECKIPASVFVKYHEMTKLPSNFVALGDSVMRSSPVYGLGVTKGMVEAVTLAGCLDKVVKSKKGIPTGFGLEVMKSNFNRTGWLWDQAKDADYGYPTTIPCKGETLEAGAPIRELTKAFFRVSTWDEEASARFYYPRLWIYPNQIMLSERVMSLCMSLREKEMSSSL